LIFYVHDENTRYQILYIYEYAIVFWAFLANRLRLNYDTAGNHPCTS
jgi:hypothetical protein